MYDWSFIRLVVKSPLLLVSVVVERMYDWSRYWRRDGRTWTVSVVVERMYDWSLLVSNNGVCHFVVSVVVERMYDWSYEFLVNNPFEFQFQLLLKGCTIEAKSVWRKVSAYIVSGVVERMYDWSFGISAGKNVKKSFSCCWKDVRLKLRNQLIENKWFLTVGFWSVFRKWSICTKSAIIFENLGWFGWLLDCFW